MIKFIAMIDTPLWVIVVTCLIIYIVSLRRRMAGLNDPRLYLSKGERRAWARKELAQREEDRDAEQFEKNTRTVFGATHHPQENQ